MLAVSGAQSLSGDQSIALEQVADRCPVSTSLESEPIRVISHLSATGGTLFAKCIASMPNVVVLNEINPFSRMQVPIGKPPFTPTDIVALVRQGEASLASDQLIKSLFLDNLAVLRKECWLTGRVLVLRDHSHSQFLYRKLDENAPTLRDVVAERFPTLSVVTTRKPENTYASMEREGWNKHFSPSTFEEYCRRCVLFENSFKSSQKFTFEDMVTKPRAVMQLLCSALEIAYESSFEHNFSAHQFSGDSGRGGNTIVER